MSIVTPFLLMALGLSTAAIGCHWLIHHHRIVRSIIWTYAGLILFAAGYWAAAGVHNSNHYPPGADERPTATIEIFQNDGISHSGGSILISVE